MSVFLCPTFGVGYQSFLTTGLPNNAGLIYTYLAGSASTAQSTFTTSSGAVQNANPIVLSADGRLSNEIWLTGGVAYKLVVTDSLNNVLGTYDNISGINDTSSTSVSEWIATNLTPTFVSSTSFTLVGNQTSILQQYRRLRSTNTGGTIYSTISSASYNAGTGLTTAVVTNDSGSLDSGISNVYYGLLNANNPSVPGIYQKASDIQSQVVSAFTTGGTSTAFTLTPSPAITANAAKQRFNVTLNAAPGASPTLSVSGQAALNFKYYDGSGTKQFINSLISPSGWNSDVINDGTDWVMQNVLQNPTQYSSISGFTLSSITGTSTTASFTISSGQATALQGSATAQTTQITKSTTTAWAASNGNAINGTDAASSTLANNATYHVFMCAGASGIGSFVSASLTPTFPTGYAVSARRIASFNTTGAGAPIPGTEIEINGGGVLRWHTTQTFDVNSTTLGTSRTLYTLNVPTGIKVQPIFRHTSGNTTGAGTAVYIITSGDETDVAPGGWITSIASPGADGINTTSAGKDGFYTTNTSGQIGCRSSIAAMGFYLVTRGYIDFRRN